jgi:Meiotically up-regulated gene 113
MTAGVYLIRAENGLVKIGYSAHVESRLALLQTGSPVGLSILHVIETDSYKELERALHAIFSAQRRRGEWFELSEDDIIAAKGHPVPRRPRKTRQPPLPQPPASPESPPPVTLSSEDDRTCQRFGRAIGIAAQRADTAEAQGQMADAERWMLIAERLFEDAKRWVESESAARMAAEAASANGVD